MMPFLLGVSSVTGHSHSLSPATRLSVHQPQHGIVYTSHKMARVHQPQDGTCTPATRWHVYTSHKMARVHQPQDGTCTPATTRQRVHQSQGGVWCHMSKRWHVATVPLCSIENPPKSKKLNRKEDLNFFLFSEYYCGCRRLARAVKGHTHSRPRKRNRSFNKNSLGA
jgi:hypothetical protein